MSWVTPELVTSVLTANASGTVIVDPATPVLTRDVSVSTACGRHWFRR